MVRFLPKPGSFFRTPFNSSMSSSSSFGILLVIAGISFLLSSCSKELAKPEEETSAASLSIADAKAHFEKNVLPSRPKRNNNTLERSMSTAPNVTDFSSLLDDREAIWDGAREKIISTGTNSILVPIDFGNLYLQTSSDGVTPLGHLNYLFMYRDSTAQIHTEWVALYPDSAWIKGDRDKYTGHLLVRDWQGSIKKGFGYREDGTVLDLSASTRQRGVGNVSLRMSSGSDNEGFECLEVSYWIYDCNCHNASPAHWRYEWVYQWSEVICVPSAYGGGTPGGGGGGFGGGDGDPGSTGGGSGPGPTPNDYTPPACDPSNLIQLPDGQGWVLPCSAYPTEISFPDPNNSVTAAQMLISLLPDGSFNSSQTNYLHTHPEAAEGLLSYLNLSANFTEAGNFISWAVGFLAANTNLNLSDLLYNRTPFDAATGDYNNNTAGGYDMNTYQEITDLSIPWQNISPVITSNHFVGWNSLQYPTWECMDYAKAQIGTLGYAISNYYDVDDFGLPQTFQGYKNGTANSNELKKGISYIKYALQNSIPVIVGVDYRAGHPGNIDNTTDHFIVIVGMGYEDGKNFLRYYDNAFGDPIKGTHSSNKLYYDTSTGLMRNTIKSNPQYDTGIFGSESVEYDYILTMIRKSKLKL